VALSEAPAIPCGDSQMTGIVGVLRGLAKAHASPPGVCTLGWFWLMSGVLEVRVAPVDMHANVWRRAERSGGLPEFGSRLHQM
jgi:hypothetical protein